jgi:hypothetical protein
MVVQLLLSREAINYGEVRLHRHLRHGQGNPSAMTDATLNGVKNMATRVPEALLPDARRDPKNSRKASIAARRRSSSIVTSDEKTPFLSDESTKTRNKKKNTYERHVDRRP